jgi:hypothetical protein
MVDTCDWRQLYCCDSHVTGSGCIVINPIFSVFWTCAVPMQHVEILAAVLPFLYSTDKSTLYSVVS